MKGLILVDLKGDIEFYSDDNGNLYHSIIGQRNILSLREGKSSYNIILKDSGYTIKYERNGFNGFSIWKSKTCLKNDIWEYQVVLNELSLIKGGK